MGPANNESRDLLLVEAQQSLEPTTSQINGAAINNKVGEDVLFGIAQAPDAESEALQMAALTQTLTSIKKLKSKEVTDERDLEGVPCKIAMENHDKIIKYLQADIVHTEGLYVVVSLRDGIILYTSSKLTEVLGYPKDMWVGRSLIDFVYPKHRISFAKHITSVIAQSDNNSGVKQSRFSCLLRQYRGLRRCGFNVTNKEVSYLPCELTTSFREVISNDPKTCNKIYLVITATPLKSAYKFGDEQCDGKVTIRHVANSQISHVDPEVTSYFGYLPQDMVGRSIFDFYHHEDLLLLKQIHQDVVKEHGHLLRSKPYRFRCQNGGYALLETEWSSFINPWTRKVEFVICQHTVIKGPQNPDVTTPVYDMEPPQLNEEEQKSMKILQDEIKFILNETVGSERREVVKQVVTKRCKDLATFMETLMDSKPPDLKVDVHAEDHSISERDSVMLGEISPHHDYYNSKASSETPPSYNQLNYNENLQRFFESRPKTTFSDESNSDMKVEPGGISSAKNSSNVDSSNNSDQRACCSTNNMSGTSSGQSTESNSNPNSGGEQTEVNKTTAKAQTGPGGNAQGYHPPTLTEQILTRHNEDMEKQMMQKHREQRSKSDKTKERNKKKAEKMEEDVGGLAGGTKRGVPHSWEGGEVYKALKQARGGVLQAVKSQNTRGQPTPNATTGPTINNPPKINVWPPFSPHPLHQRNLTTPTLANPIVPMYYSTFQEPANQQTLPYQHSTYIAPPVQYVPGMMYHPLMFGGPPMIYSPLTVLPSPIFPQTTPMKPQGLSSDKGKSPGQRSPLGPRSPKKLEPDADSNTASNACDDSSIYSSFYSFLRTEKSDESAKSSPENDSKAEDMVWENSKRRSSPRRMGRPIKKMAPWLEEINVTPELILKYQLQERDLADILSEDFKALERITQPVLVNDQLSQMYLDLELEGLSRKLTLEEGVTSSSESSSDDNATSAKLQIKKKKYMEYDKMAILFEENAPLPPPLLTGATPVPTSCN